MQEFSTEQNFDTMSAGFGPEPSRDGSNYVISAHSGRDLPDPPEFGTSSNSAWVHFKTDSERIDRGFKLEVYDSAVKGMVLLFFVIVVNSERDRDAKRL